MGPAASLGALSGLVCALLSAGLGAISPSPANEPAIIRGAEIAQARCAGCHGVALEAASPVHDAPLFRVLSRLYSAERLEMKLLDISENGHFEMPRVEMSEADATDLAQYIASLDGGAADPPRRGRSTTAAAP